MLRKVLNSGKSGPKEFHFELSDHEGNTSFKT